MFKSTVALTEDSGFQHTCGGSPRYIAQVPWDLISSSDFNGYQVHKWGTHMCRQSTQTQNVKVLNKSFLEKGMGGWLGENVVEEQEEE